MPTTNLWPFGKTTSGGFWDVMQVVAAMSGQNDIGAWQAFPQINPPTALTATVNAVSGNLAGNYQYAVAFGTGYLQGDPQNPGAGTLHKFGNTGGGTVSATVSPAGQQVNLSNIPIGGTGVVARFLYRTKAGGSVFYFLAEIDDNTSTTWPDNIADASLGTAMPTTNTTGSWFQGKFVGDGSGITNIPTPADVAKLDVAQPWTAEQMFAAITATSASIAGNNVLTTASAIPAGQLPVATTGTLGLVEIGSGITVNAGVISAEPYTLPGDVAKTDVAQPWTAAQTFNALITIGANLKVTGDNDFANYNGVGTVPDVNNHYTVTTYTRPSANKYMVSTLSGTMDSFGNYPTMVNVFYKTDGVTVDHTDTWTLTFDANGIKSGQSVVRS